VQRNRVYHITTKQEADNAASAGSYAPAAFAREGFIHCSYEHQVAAVANRIFKGQQNLVVLEIDPEKTSHRIVDENLEGGAELFPHIYGRLPMSAVTRTHDFPCDASGQFVFL
jgi:uncharacterized protein (DUF952 family)